MTGREADGGTGEFALGGEAVELNLGDEAVELLLRGEPVDLVFGDDEAEDEGDLEFLLVPLLTEAERQMRSIRRPLDAEMWASELLGMLELGATDDSTAEEREAVTLNLATRMAEHAIDLNSPSGLAILRTLSVIGPPESRELARAAATRMAEGGQPAESGQAAAGVQAVESGQADAGVQTAADDQTAADNQTAGGDQAVGGGLRDRAWAASLGRPEVRRCWRFGDPDGTQESVTVVFGYGEQEHTLSVLIDHELGGGVKDCWVGESPDGVLAETLAALEPEGIEVEFVPVEAVRERLRSALGRPECPVTPDEIEDLAMTRALLRARVELLVSGPTGGTGSTPGTLEG